MDDAFIQDLFSSVGPVTIRKMFGGQGIYVDGTICAAVVDGQLMVKGDDQCRAIYDEAGMAQWQTENAKTGRVSHMPYWQVPDGALDDPAEFAKWAEAGLHAALRSKAGKSKKA
ncbi:MAG: TfoX/Sxy family protein [Pseudomonadota bacterium]